MKLLDFKEFEAFNDLRDAMGAVELGYFELFDPAKHLTGQERSELQLSGWLRPLELIRVLPDGTLAIKNSRVIAYVPDENYFRDRREYPVYHVAFCTRLEEMKKTSQPPDLLVTTRIAEDYSLLKLRSGGEFSVQSQGFVVCEQCLHKLRYRDFDLYRNRRRGYSQKVLKEFSLDAFFRLYRQYPLSFNTRPG